MVTCCIPNCDNNFDQSETRIFFPFPNSTNSYQIWTNKIREKLGVNGWIPPENATICDKHFEDACFIRCNVTTALTPGSVPTIFVLELGETHEAKKRKIQMDDTVHLQNHYSENSEMDIGEDMVNVVKDEIEIENHDLEQYNIYDYDVKIEVVDDDLQFEKDETTKLQPVEEVVSCTRCSDDFEILQDSPKVREDPDNILSGNTEIRLYENSEGVVDSDGELYEEQAVFNYVVEQEDSPSESESQLNDDEENIFPQTKRQHMEIEDLSESSENEQTPDCTFATAASQGDVDNNEAAKFDDEMDQPEWDDSVIEIEPIPNSPTMLETSTLSSERRARLKLSALHAEIVLLEALKDLCIKKLKFKKEMYKVDFVHMKMSKT